MIKKGDRVVVYATLNGQPVRSPGTVVQVGPEKYLDTRLSVRMDSVLTAPYIFAHVKQCRKLRERRRIWLPVGNHDGATVLCVSEKQLLNGQEAIEFIEVRKKK